MEPEQVDALLARYFDEAFYRAAYIAAEDGRDPRRVFWDEGDKLRHRPSLAFDPLFYFERYGDARESGSAPLRHFMNKGMARGYAPNRFRQLLQAGRADGLLDGRLLGLEREPGEDEAAWVDRLEIAFERFLLAAGAAPLADPSPRFSTAFYLERYPQAAESGEHALVHYLRDGMARNYAPNRFRQLMQGGRGEGLLDGRLLGLRREPGELDEAWVDRLEIAFEQFMRAADADPLTDPSLHFSTAFYLDRYPQVVDSGEHALVHYLREGMARNYAPNRFRQLLQAGRADGLLDGRLFALEREPSEDDMAWLDRLEIAFERFMLAADAEPLADPSPRFSTTFYLERYPEAVQDGEHPLVHYLREGLSRNYAPNRFRQLIQGGRGDGLLDGRLLGPERQPGEDDAAWLDRLEIAFEHFMRAADADPMADPSPRFSTAFYLERYPKVLQDGEHALVHYLREGIARGYATNRFRQLMQAGRGEALLDGLLLGLVRSADEPDAAWVDRLEIAFEQYMQVAEADPLADPSARFSTTFYRERYPKVADSGEHPFMHYLRAGIAEGRETSADVLATLRDGRRRFDPALPTAIVCLHELSLTGAPIVGLDLIEALAPTHNLVCLSRRGGVLEPRLAAATVAYSLDVLTPLQAYVLVEELRRRGEIAFALVNSVEAWHCLPALNLLGAPILTLIHEYADYVYPRERVPRTVLLSDRLMFSSQAIADGWERAVADRYEVAFRHKTIRHQAPATIELRPAADRAALRARLAAELDLPLAGRKLVLGAGSIQIRKGTDLFLATAQALDRLVAQGALAEDEPAFFLWIGGVPDRADSSFGLWLDQASAHASPARVAFVPAGPLYRDLIASADLLYLSSRLDPLPNVVIDALCAGTPVMLFEGATGCPETLDRFGVPYLTAGFGDILDAAAQIAAHATTTPEERAIISDRARKAFAFAPYVADVLAAVEAIRADRAEAARDPLAATLDEDYFRLPHAEILFGRGHDPAATRTFWLRALHAGLDSFNPRAGLNVRNAREGRLIADAPLRTHRSVTLGEAPAEPADLPYAVHYHAYFTDGFADLLERFRPTFTGAARVLVTTASTIKGQELIDVAQAAGVDCGVLNLLNRGRNFGPLLELASRDAFAGCELVLHVHAKRSWHLNEKRAKRWRDYLFDMLLDPARVAEVRARFAREPALGSVWPENQRAPGWSGNAAAARKLMGPEWTPTPSPRQFPNGGMLWVRTGVLARAWRSLDLDLDDLPVEPIPEDGTILHALERLWPELVERAGAEWATLHDPKLSRY